MRVTAIVLALVWATSWTVFGILASAGSGYFVPVAVFAVLMFGSVALAWKLPILGGALLIIEAIGAWIAFGPSWLRWSPASSTIMLCGTIIAPPLLSGLLFLAAGVRDHWKQGRSIQALHLSS